MKRGGLAPLPSTAQHSKAQHSTLHAHTQKHICLVLTNVCWKVHVGVSSCILNLRKQAFFCCLDCYNVRPLSKIIVNNRLLMIPQQLYNSTRTVLHFWAFSTKTSRMLRCREGVCSFLRYSDSCKTYIWSFNNTHITVFLNKQQDLSFHLCS